MGKKIKSKQRLDKFYHFAKEQGYRSRAAFKLIQLNRKYSFLQNANILIDLCAAPGGWLQVADQFMPISSIKLGFDLDPIKPIPHCKTFVEDITKPGCLNIIKREIHGQKADIVLHDGAPNVGANWSKDAYSQSELVLQALKLATQVLKQGGTFVTKVFRSNDYNSLIWVFNKFFEKVEATKPEASRLTSAEIFVVCNRYLAPNYIDPNLFDAKCVFKDTEAENLLENRYREITSLGKLLEKRKWRGGYEDDVPQNMFKKCTLGEFLSRENPFPVFMEFNQIEITPEDREKYISLGKLPEDFEENLKDLKVLGKRELGGILKWRGKVLQAIRKKERKERGIVEEEKEQEEPEEEIKSEEELEEKIHKAEHEEIQKQRKLKEKKEKQYVKYAKNYGETIENAEVFEEENDDDELFDIFKHKKVLKKVGYINPEEEEDEANKKQRFQQRTKPAGLKDMEMNIEDYYESKVQKQNKKATKAVSASESKKAPARHKLGSTEQFSLEEEENHENMVKNGENIDSQAKSTAISKLLKKKWFDKPLFQDLLEPSANYFKNPLKDNETGEKDINDSEGEDEPKKQPAKPKKKPDFDDMDSEEEADKYQIKVPVSEMEKRRRKLKRQRQKDQKKEKKGGLNDNDFEVVETSEHRLEDYDIDTAAETLALAKKMLRKKDRETIIDSTYSKYAFEDQDEAPKWFREDELTHNHLILPITKEEFQAEKDRLMAVNSKTPKKIMEAKIRNYKRAAKKMKRTKQKAEVIFEQEGVSEGMKVRQIKKLYKKEAAGLEKKKKYVVGKRNQAGPGKNSRSMKFVDKRLRKDKRRDKDKDRKGVSKKIKKVRGNKKFNRRKRK